MPPQVELDKRQEFLRRMRNMTEAERDAFVEGAIATREYISVIYDYLEQRSKLDGPTYYQTVWEAEKRGLGSAIHDTGALVSVLRYAAKRM